VIGLGVIGYGYWGPNLVRNFFESPAVKLVAVSDLRPQNLARVQSRYPTVHTTTEWQDIVSHPGVDAVAIATPVSTHYEMAEHALKSGKHVFVEKPMTETSEQALRLIDEASRRNLVLMVDHTFCFTGAVQKIRNLVQSGDLGDIYYYDSTRINLGLFQHDVSVIWDLAVHDLAIMDFALQAKPLAISATGISHVPGQPENTAYVTLFCEHSLIAHINVNWLAPVKVRQTLIGGSKKMLVYDDIEPSEKIKVYDRGITVQNDRDNIYRMLVDYRTGDMWAPRLSMQEALKVETALFSECIEKGTTPFNDGQAGLRIVRVLEAAMQSVRQQGKAITLC
jgi:predicted dehydrogenase